MKTTIKLIGIIALIAVIGFAIAACDDGSTEHTHQWGSWSVTTAATCSAKGVETRVCSLDAAHKETREIAIDPDAHSYGAWVVTKPATETEDGEETRTCAHNAAHKETRLIVAFGHTHNWGDWERISDPDCTRGGVETRTCTLNAAHTQNRSVVALGHTWGEWKQTTAPTCTRPGVETAACTIDGTIGARNGAPIVPDAHQWGEWHQTKAPAVNVEGVETRTCILYPAHKETRPIPALPAPTPPGPPPPPPPPTAPTITTTFLQDGAIDVAYIQTLTATGTTPITWGIISGLGTLPDGLELSTGGEISGTPSDSVTPGTFTFTVNATNSRGSAAKSLSILITATAVGPTVTTTSLPDGTVGEVYNQQLRASGTASITWSITSGTLPAGLVLNENTGAITGTPTTAGAGATITFNAHNDTDDGTKDLSIIINGPPRITTNSLPAGEVTQSYNEVLTATGYPAPTWTVTGTLPTGISHTTGTISGTPTISGVFDITVTATNAGGSDSKPLSITISGPPRITTTTLPPGAVTVPYNQTLQATGYPTGFTWTQTAGTMPDGLTLNTTTGAITGTPTTVETQSVTFKATNSEGDSTPQAISIVINAAPVPPTITYGASLPNGTVDNVYSNVTLTATGDATITWSIDSGSLPAGLDLSTAGVISGTPTAAVTSASITFKATNSGGSDTKAITITIEDNVFTAVATFSTWLTAQTANAVGTAYNVKFNDATGIAALATALKGAGGTGKYVNLDLSGNALTSLGNNALQGCTTITSVIFPTGLTAIGEEAFAGCTNLKSVEFKGGSVSIEADSFLGDLKDKYEAPGAAGGVGTYTTSDTTTWTKS